MTVFRHLLSVHRRLYLGFWAVMSLFFLIIVTLFGAFGDLAFRGVEVTMWEGSANQAPRWFLFVMGIMQVTMTLPVLIAHGITRKAFWRAGLAFVVFSALLFTVLVMVGMGLETALFSANGGVSRLPDTYPMASAGNAVAYTAISFLAMAGYMLSGLLIGLVYYRMRVWQAIVLTPLALLPIIGAQLPPQSSLTLRLLVPLAAVLLAVPGSFAVMRTIPVRPKKA